MISPQFIKVVKSPTISNPGCYIFPTTSKHHCHLITLPCPYPVHSESLACLITLCMISLPSECCTAVSVDTRIAIVRFLGQLQNLTHTQEAYLWVCQNPYSWAGVQVWVAIENPRVTTSTTKYWFCDWNPCQALNQTTIDTIQVSSDSLWISPW